MHFIGANWLMRKIAANATPNIEIFQNGDHFVIKAIVGPMTKEESFTVGEEYEQADMGTQKQKVCTSIHALFIL